MNLAILPWTSDLYKHGGFMKKFLIIANETKDIDLKYSKYAEAKIKEKDAEASICVGSDSADLSDALDSVEAVIVMGGDGTMLRVAHALEGRTTPVIGVNLGVVGFLTEVVVSEIDAMIDRLINDDFVIEDRMMLSGTVHTKDGDTKLDALNDIVLARESALRLTAVGIYVNGRAFDTTEADGIILSTPTGSTGYNLSAGGPIVQPDARLMVLTPISPYSMSRRSVVFGADDVITLELLEKRKDIENIGLISFDGAESFNIHVGDTVDIRVSDKIFKIIKLEEVGVYEILRKKLGG